MAVLKVVSLVVAIGLFFGFFVFGPGYEAMAAQSLLLVILLVANTLRNGWVSTRTVCAAVLPFVLSLMVFGLLFDWLHLLGREDWIEDSLCKALVFPNSFVVMKLGLESITFRDILRLPLPPGPRRMCIVFKAVMERCAPLLQRHRYFMDLCPHFDHQRGALLTKLCAVIVATYISIYRQTEKTQALFDHRQQYVRKNV